MDTHFEKQVDYLIKESVVCDSCGTKDSFIYYFSGPDGFCRECRSCGNKQSGIDKCVDSCQSDDPPELRHCYCGEILECQHGISDMCNACYMNAIEILAWYENSKHTDAMLEQQEKSDFENIEYEYFDLSGDSVPF